MNNLKLHTLAEELQNSIDPIVTHLRQQGVIWGEPHSSLRFFEVLSKKLSQGDIDSMSEAIGKTKNVSFCELIILLSRQL